jgi:hypothetical protein
VTGTFGIAWVVADGRVRRIGVALIVGDVLGALLFAYSFFWAFAHVSIGLGLKRSSLNRTDMPLSVDGVFSETVMCRSRGELHGQLEVDGGGRHCHLLHTPELSVRLVMLAASGLKGWPSYPPSRRSARWPRSISMRRL